jgi:GAF domain-containing protein
MGLLARGLVLQPLDDTLSLVVRRVRRLLAAQAAAIYSLEGPDGTLGVQATQGLISALLSETSSLAIRPLLQEAITQGQPVVAAELPVAAGRNPDLNRETDLHSQAEKAGGFLAAPILLRDLVYGALVVYHSGPRSITVEDKDLSALMAAQAALAVENARLGIMRERANAIGAHLSVPSRPGQGTTITVSWPSAECTGSRAPDRAGTYSPEG